jgi:hypothetical protein
MPVKAMCVVVMLAVATRALVATAQAQPSFQFESVVTLDDMQRFVRSNFPLGADRASLRRSFVEQGKGTLKMHPTQTGVEKYLYDINLCGYYVWRWNISADFDSSGKLLQAYVNGEPVHAAGTPKKDSKIATIAQPGKTAGIFKIERPRPEAIKGEKRLGAIVADADGNLRTIDDQILMGAGPTRADPANLGTMKKYEVEPWRSIFDIDNADRVVPYAGDCNKADAVMDAQARSRSR